MFRRQVGRFFSTQQRHQLHSTTVLSVRKDNQVVMIADGQISLGPTVFKTTAKKLRRLDNNVVCGFAGTAADCLALMELLEKEFEKYPGQTLRACLALAKQWRTTKIHSQLSADLIVSDPEITVLVDGSGNCIEIEDGLVAIGSGGLYAQSAAKALLGVHGLQASEIADQAMRIAADLCVYSNHNTIKEVLVRPGFDSFGYKLEGDLPAGVRKLLEYCGRTCPDKETGVEFSVSVEGSILTDRVKQVKIIAATHMP